MPNPPKVYLGDAVYAEWVDGPALMLTTSNGLVDSNTIYLEPKVIQALQRYIIKGSEEVENA